MQLVWIESEAVGSDAVQVLSCVRIRDGRSSWVKKWDIEHAHGLHVARKPEQLKDAFADLTEEEAEQYEDFIVQVVEMLLEEV
jgi:hypothetical protein